MGTALRAHHLLALLGLLGGWVRVCGGGLGLGVGVGVALTGSGCTTAEPLPYAEALADLPRRAEQLALRMAIAPPEVLASADAARLASQPARRAVPDLAAVLTALAEAVRASGAAGDAIELEGPRVGADEGREAGDDPDGEARRGRAEPPSTPLALLAAEAREGGADLLLRARVRRANVRYVGVNGHFVTFALVFLNFWFPAYWVADERYEAELEVEVELYRVPPGRNVPATRVLRRILVAKGEVQLSPIDRGWNFLGSFTVPEALDDECYAEAAAHALPHALVDLARRLAGVLADADLSDADSGR